MPYRLRNASADYREMDDEPENSALAANMRRLMNGRSIETIRAEMAEAGLPIGTGTLHRAVQGQVGNRLGSLEKIAAFFGVMADQLLQENLGTDRGMWPFSDELLALVSALPPDDLRGLEGSMWAHLKLPAPAALYTDSLSLSLTTDELQRVERLTGTHTKSGRWKKNRGP